MMWTSDDLVGCKLDMATSPPNPQSVAASPRPSLRKDLNQFGERHGVESEAPSGGVSAFLYSLS